MSEDFIRDLNEYFSKKYENYDLISSMPSYESVTIAMVLKNKNRIEEGEYTANEMRKISYQPNAELVLSEIKQRYVDDNFSFSFRIAPFGQRFRAFFGSGVTGKALYSAIKKYGEEPESAYEKFGVSEKDWKKLLRGYYVPEKVLLFRIFLVLGMRSDDCAALMRICGLSMNHEDARDVVVNYLLDYRVFNREMIDRAFEEFNIRKIL